MRWSIAPLGVLACGPDAGTPASSAEGGATTDEGGETTVVVDTSQGDGASDTSGIGPSSSTGSDDAVDTTSTFDVGGSESSSTGEPVEPCEMPERANADVHGTTPMGDVAMTAAVFARDGGGKCPDLYRVVIAADPAALAVEIEQYAADEPPFDVIELSLELPDGVPTPGTWAATVRHVRNGEVLVVYGVMADVTSVTAIDDVDAHVEATFTVVDEQLMLDGSVHAPYCATVHGSGCGA